MRFMRDPELHATMVMRTLVVSVLTLLRIYAVSSDCGTHSSCDSCIADSEWWLGCRWCPLTEGCYSILSGTNECSSSQQITSSFGNCSKNAKSDSSLYDSEVAAQLAKWCSLSYISLEQISRQLANQLVNSIIGPNYQMVEFLISNCGMPMEKGDCAVVISMSQVERRIVLAFRGTSTNLQLFTEFLGGFEGFLDFEPTGGQIVSYFKMAHYSLYACVKWRLQKLLALNPEFYIYVTGHSLGGVEAQLMAVNLIADGVIPKSKVKVYTFGSPRVGDKEFAYNYDKIVGESWRIIHEYDPVPKIVPKDLLFISYTYHTRQEVYYDMVEITPESNYTLCHGNEDEVHCSGKDVICLTPTCMYSHLKYFLPSIHGTIEKKYYKLSSATSVQRQRKLKRTMRGACSCYTY